MLTYREADEYTAPRRGGGPAGQPRHLLGGCGPPPGHLPGRFRRPGCYHCNKLLAEKGTVIVCNRCKVRKWRAIKSWLNLS